MSVLSFQWMLGASYLLHFLWEFIVHTKWRLDGTRREIEASRSGSKKDQSAQVLRVIWTNPLLKTVHVTPQTYFTVHERFAPAEIVLNNRMHLLSVTSKTAIFTEVDCDIMDVRKFPFTYISQTSRTTRLVIIPIKYFYELVDNIDVRDRRVVWMFHTTRCGSTAWVQAFNSLPGWTVYSEPQAFFYSVMHGDHGYHSAESYSKSAACKQMAVAIIKMLVRQAPSGGSVLWKASVYEDYLMNMIAECFPEHQMLVAYRDSFPSTTSFYRSFYKWDYFRYYAEVKLNHDPSDKEWWFHLPNPSFWTNGCDHNFCHRVITKVRPRTGVEWYCFVWSAKAAAIRHAIKDGVQANYISYESLCKDRRRTVEKVFNYLDLPLRYVDLACEALESDSQAGVAKVSWDTRRKGEATEWSNDPDVVKRCNMILEAFGLPDLNSPLEFYD